MSRHFVVEGHRFATDNELIGCHPMSAARRKRRDAEAVAWAALAARIPTWPSPSARRDARALGVALPKSHPPARRRLTLEFAGPFRRGPDPTAHLRSLPDACVTAGLLWDDSGGWCELAYPPIYIRAKSYNTVITIEDIA